MCRTSCGRMAGSPAHRKGGISLMPPVVAGLVLPAVVETKDPLTTGKQAGSRSVIGSSWAARVHIWSRCCVTTANHVILQLLLSTGSASSLLMAGGRLWSILSLKGLRDVLQGTVASGSPRGGSVVDRLIGQRPEIPADIWRAGRGPHALGH